MNNWKKNRQFVADHMALNSDIFHAIRASIVCDAAFSDSPTLYEYQRTGVSVENTETLIKHIEDLNGKCIKSSLGTFKPYEDALGEVDETENYNKIFTWDHGIVKLFVEDSEDGASIELRCASNDKHFITVVKELAEKFISTSSSGHIYVFTTTRSGMTLTPSPGKISHPFERNNYSDTVLKNYDHVLSELNAENPCGRLVLISGEAGTGKTFLIRGLIEQINDAKFVLVPAGMVSAVDKPEFVKTLLEAKSTSNKPLILVLEDADACLVARKSDNISAISSLLNMSDGIFGNLFNLRLLATTNAIVTELDEAIVRPGRLCSHIQVDKLSSTKANETFKRLTKSNNSPYCQSASLAEVYKAAKMQGAVINNEHEEKLVKVTRKVGFSF